MALSKIKWHSLSIEDALTQTKSKSSGLSTAEVAQRLIDYGHNQLPAQKPFSRLSLLWNQFNNPLMYILLATVGISILLKHYTDTIFIGLVLVSNVAVAYYQESKAGNAIASLKKMVKIQARVLRENGEKQIDSTELVPGDIIILQSGDKVPADARIVQARQLAVSEASLTGESQSVKKNSEIIDSKKSIADQTNMVFMGTIVEEGWAKALVVETGTGTQIGEIIQLLAETEEPLTPLQKQISKLAKLAAGFIVCIIIFIAVIGLIRGTSPADILLASLSLTVSAIPAGLLPAITIILVLAMRRIFKHKGLVRKLVSTETLGSITVICTDKTGTLTLGQMAVTHLVSESYELSGTDLAKFTIEDPNPKTELLKDLAKIATFNNDAFIENPTESPKNWLIRGKITEQALLAQATKMGFVKQTLEQEHLLIDKIYFSSNIKYSASLRELPNNRVGLFIVGAPEIIFTKSSRVQGSHAQPKDSKLHEQTQKLARQGLRVIACAYKEFDKLPKYKKLEEQINDLTLVGIIALEDPIRDEVIEAIQTTKRAGIRTVICTGDHKITAAAIAAKIGLKVTPDEILEGLEVENMSDDELAVRIKTIHIFARVSPKHKLRIVDALQAHGEVVAMVGDGVNDAPALKSADIGVAVGSGTDVAKEVADLVLLDNGFHTIVKAIEQGRVIFSNIRKVFIYLLADDFQELYIFFAAMALGLPLPLLPAQILWINLVEDGLPDLSLTTEQETSYVMDQPPRPRNEPVVNRPLKQWLIAIFMISGTSALILFFAGLSFGLDLQKIRTMVFALMGLDSLLFVFSARSFRRTIFRRDIFSNKYMVAAVSISLILLFCAIYTPGLQKLLSTVALNWHEWFLIFGISIMEIILIEFAKVHLLFKHNRSVML